MHEPSRLEQSLLDKLHQLPPDKVGEVVDFVEFLAQRHAREDERHLVQATSKLSEGAFAAVWDNAEDAVYDTL